MTSSAPSTGAALAAMGENSDLTETQIFAVLPNPVFVLDRQNRFVYLNQAAEIFFQSSQMILLGTTINSIMPGDSNFLSMVSRSRAQSISVGDQGVELISPKIGLKLINVQITPFGDREPRLLITIQERALAERLRGQSVFRGAARSIAAMAALLAHEVKNPLAGIKGAAQLLEADLDAGGQSLTRMIVEESDRVAALLDRMEGFAGGANLMLVPVNIHEILDHCLSLAQASYGARVKIKRSYDPSLPLINGHRDLLIQAFINMIKNAAEATNLGGEITLKTSYAQGRRLTFAAVDGGSYAPVQVEVTDNGRGISEELREYIFDPFVSDRPGGSGLGLTMVASVIADHGAMIDVESMPGQTVFRMNFPVAPKFEQAREEARQ